MLEPLAKPLASSKVPLDRLTCLSGDPVRSEVLGPEPGSAALDPMQIESVRDAIEQELEARLAPDGLLTGPLTPEACEAYLQRRSS
jgi:hypothetical protein